MLLCLSFLSFKMLAQKAPENQLGTWYMYNGSHKLSKKYALKTMAHFRYFELTEQFQQEIYRLGLNYAFSPKTNITLGLSYATADLEYNAPSVNLYEYRFYEDVNIKSKWGAFNARHRFRLEHRFIRVNLIDDTRNWFRYDLTVNYPISKKWSVYAFNELFLNFKGDLFSQNWTGAGFLHQLNKNVKLKMGYFQIKSTNNILKRMQLGVILNTNHLKKNKL